MLLRHQEQWKFYESDVIVGNEPFAEISVFHDQPLGTLFIAPIMDPLAMTDTDFHHGVNSEICITLT